MTIAPNCLSDQSPDSLVRNVRQTLCNGGAACVPAAAAGSGRGSAVLLPLSIHPDAGRPEPCLIFNKRSLKVRQPGDLCYPGGAISPADRLLAGLLRLPGTTLSKWPCWRLCRKRRDHAAGRLALLWAACLREAWEEMRLNPLRLTLLGPLPTQRLVTFDRLIFPIAAWVPPRQHFRLNWEVERVVTIPLKRLMDSSRYRLFRPATAVGTAAGLRLKEYPCFLHHDEAGQEILWGATFRITMDFLDIVFGFRPPAPGGLEVIEGRLSKAYFRSRHPGKS